MWQEIIKANVDDRIILFVDNADEIFRRDFARKLNAFESATGLDPLPDSVQFENNLELKINYKSDAVATDLDFAFNFEIDGGIYLTTDGEIEDGPRRAFQQFRYDESDLDEGILASFDKEEHFEFRVNFNNFYREGQQYVLKDGKMGLTLEASVTKFNSSEMRWIVEIVISRD
jgi:hypothetical protein|tara:strand:+ start:665 stop:1183 length:519 start_codon:yes stop_codon:yes gene_type:complete